MKVVALAAVGSALLGMFLSGAFASFLQYSQTTDFFLSCHETEGTIYVEYKDTVHYKSRTGERRTPL